ncbi:DUF928 domain-containing protein [Candidatus Halobeggiatoa sp. HSG11]|nr:DUF928 domain-containing protein [Candidatus Halobeggiatoa sp. HSG11]
MNSIKFITLSLAMFAVMNVTALDKISYQGAEFNDNVREFKADVRGIRGMRGMRGMRGTCTQMQDDFALRLLVPKNTGKTISSHPILYWWVSQPLQDAELLLIIDKLATDNDFEFAPPLVKKEFKMSVSKGIQALPIPDFELIPGIKYQINLSINCHKDYPSLDVSATGSIIRIKPTAQLTTELKASSKDKLPLIYAKHGFWYDALDELSKHIQTSKDSSQLRQMRANLLQQVDLNID